MLLHENIKIIDYYQNNEIIEVCVLAKKFRIGFKNSNSRISCQIKMNFTKHGLKIKIICVLLKLTKLRKCEGSEIDNEILLWFSKVWENVAWFGTPRWLENPYSV